MAKDGQCNKHPFAHAKYFPGSQYLVSLLGDYQKAQLYLLRNETSPALSFLMSAQL